MRLSQAIKGFLIARSADGYSENTLNIFRNHLGRQLIEFLGDIEVDAVTPQDLQGFMAWLREGYIPKRRNGDTSPLSPSSLSNAWCSIRSFFRWASEELGIERPDLLLRQPKWVRPEITPFSPEEVARLLAAAEYTSEAVTHGRSSFRMRRATAHRDRAILLLLLDTGLRVSECARLRVQDVVMETGEVYVRAFGSGQKTKSRHVYLGKAARRALWHYLAKRDDLHPDDPLFEARDRPMDRNSIRHIMMRLGERSGVLGVYPHRFRHTFAIQYLRNGGDVFTLQRLLGHSTLDMVKHYVALADADVAEAHRKASPADRWHL
ncbi:MAG: tyrosine-type recombinase/integrase [Anaerolineae bacterium]|nr:tyrosine-type recombinase/integrase [Anaerolineae bacterium]